MVEFGAILKFDPGQIQEIFGACSGQQQTCSTIDGHLKNLSDLHTWQGDASQAAKDAAGKTRKDLDAHGNEVWKVAAAARDCYNEAVELKASAQRVQADADAKGCMIDPTTGTVTPPAMQGWADADKAAFYVEVNALQARVNDVIAAAERFDDDLAAAINAADGSIPLTPKGESANVNLADRRANQVAAYRKTYGKDPVTANDWRMAEALDPHTYDPKYKGALANVAVGRMTPSPGHGVTRANLYIPSDEVQNLTLNPLDVSRGQGLPHNVGDNRGPDPLADAEHSRVSLFVDHENGVVVARQNPTLVTAGPNQPKAGVPQVEAVQSPGGGVRIRYFGADTYQPKLATDAHIGVSGELAIQPESGGGVASGGTITAYPSAEVYNYSPAGEITTLVDHRATMDQNGPMFGLLRGPQLQIGQEQPLIPDIFGHDEMGSGSYLENFASKQKPDAAVVGTPLGSADAPPTIATAESR